MQVDDSSAEDVPIPQVPTAPVGLDNVQVQSQTTVPASSGWFGAKSQEDIAKKERRIRAQIRHLIRLHPEIKLKKLTDDELQLKSLGIEDLEEVLENILSQLHGPSPYASTCSGVEAFGMLVEKKLGVTGYADRLVGDLDFVSAVDSVLPTAISDASTPITIVWRGLKNLFDTYTHNAKQDAHEQSKKQADVSSSVSDDDSGEESDGKDNLASGVLPEKRKRSGVIRFVVRISKISIQVIETY